MPRTSATLSRLAQGVSSFAFAAAGTNGFVTSVLTFAVAGVVCTVGALAAGEAGRIGDTFHIPRLWTTGIVGFLAMYLAAEAYHRADVAPVSFLLLLVPVFTALTAPLAGERLTREGALGLVISVIGIALFAQPQHGTVAQWPGLLCALAASGALAWLWYLSRDLASHDDRLWALSAAQNYLPALVGLAALPVMGGFPAGVPLVWLLVSGAGYAANTILRLYCLRILPASTASLIAPISAIVSTVLGIAVLGEIPDARVCAGAVVITIGVMVSAGIIGRTQTAAAEDG